MLFNSLEFLIFFPVVTTLYFLLPHKYRWSMLLLASCVFYMAFIPAYILILFVTIGIDYFAGMWIEEAKTQVQKKRLLLMSILSTCLVLFIFKYFNFFNTNIASIAHFLHWNYPIGYLQIILPIGLSFHTFQSLSYVIEVYRNHQKAERHFGIYALYVMFYPQLVAGPIERPQNMLHQFYEKHNFDYQRVINGLRLMGWGLLKKVVIADNLAIAVNQVYNNLPQFSGLSLIVATVFFAFQIYCDFSGYSDIAIGSAEVMGYRLMLNFNRPYFSKSISEFWKRWHISLSTWFRDYLYISLGGNRVSKWRWQLNLFITFLVSGLWHGASWNFVIWGALNGFYLVFSLWTSRIREGLVRVTRIGSFPFIHKSLQVFITFFITCFAWIFFRANNLSDAIYVIKNSLDVFNYSGLHHAINSLMGIMNIKLSLFLVVFLLIAEFFLRKSSIERWIFEKPLLIRWACYYLIILTIIFFGVFDNTQFIYFQF